MKRLLLAGLLAATLASGGPLRAAAEDATPLPASIGAATMAPDGTITLRLRAEGPGGKIGEGQFSYRPGSAQYDEVLGHIGGLKPGQTKAVPPWTD
jgi:hypothetical protein